VPKVRKGNRDYRGWGRGETCKWSEYGWKEKQGG